MSAGVGAAQVAAVLAVGAAAVSFVAGLGSYLYIRFTQHRWKGPQPCRPPSPKPPPAGESPVDSTRRD